MPAGDPPPFLPPFHSPYQPYSGFPQNQVLPLSDGRSAVLMHYGSVEYNRELHQITLLLERSGATQVPLMLLDEKGASLLVFWLQRALAQMRGVPFPPLEEEPTP